MCIVCALYVHTLTHLLAGALDHPQLGGGGNVTYPIIFFQMEKVIFIDIHTFSEATL